MLSKRTQLPKTSTLAWIAAVFILICSSCSQTETKFRIELVKLKTADGVWLNGVVRELYSKPADVGVVMVHGYGGNFYSGTLSFLPEALTVHGYTTLALNMRDHDLGPKKNRFEENLPDIAAGVDELARRGYKNLFLYGHSMGTNRVLFYLAETQDQRIKGIILSGPPGNLFQWNLRIFGREAATAVLRRAQKLKGEGKGDTWMVIDLGPLGKTLYTADHVVSLRGPETRSDPFKNIARLSKPVLIVHGLGDRLAHPSVADKLKNSAAAENQVKVVKLTGADHRFRNHQDELKEIIIEWLGNQMK